jgi:heme/copper-type cytochrome/quinol oxidase subunit 3
MTYAAFLLGLFQIPFIINLFLQTRPRSNREPGTGNREPDNQFASGSRLPDPGSRVKPETGTSSAKLGMWLLLASEAMLFASLFSGYVMLRTGAADWPRMPGGFPWLETLLLVGASAAFGAKRSQLVVSNTLGLTFVAIKILNDVALIGTGITPATNLMWACWFTLTGVHAFHVLAGAVFTGWLAGPSFRMAEEDRERWLARIEATRRYWLFVDAIWLMLIVSVYFV